MPTPFRGLNGQQIKAGQVTVGRMSIYKPNGSITRAVLLEFHDADNPSNPVLIWVYADEPIRFFFEENSCSTMENPHA